MGEGEHEGGDHHVEMPHGYSVGPKVNPRRPVADVADQGIKARQQSCKYGICDQCVYE